MRRLLAMGLVLALSAPLVASQVQVKTYASLTVADSSVGLASATISPDGQQQIAQCYARLETAQIRYRWDGTAPTSSEGILLEVGDTLTIDGFDVASAIRFIRTGATSGVLKVSCWK